MSKKDNSAIAKLVLDKSLIEEFIMPMLGESPKCLGCQKTVTRNSFGAACKINGEVAVWHNEIFCLMNFIKKQEIGS